MNKEKRREYFKKWKEKHPDYFRNYVAKWKREHQFQTKEQTKRARIKHRQEIREKRIQLKIEVLTHYGNGECACVQCGFNDIRGLSIDHVNNNGAAERGYKRNNVNSGLTLYRRLRILKYPLGYQTLCMNCQWIKELDNRFASRK